MTHTRTIESATSEGGLPYGVATACSLPKNIGLFCERALQNSGSFAKETYIFREPTSRSHPIAVISAKHCDMIMSAKLCLKVKRLVLKCIGTQKRLFPEILAARVGCSRCHNFLPRHITTRQPYIHI